jgi:hypothetical protein
MNQTIEQQLVSLYNEIVSIKKSILKRNDIVLSEDNIDLYYEYATENDIARLNTLDASINTLRNERIALINQQKAGKLSSFVCSYRTL